MILATFRMLFIKCKSLPFQTMLIFGDLHDLGMRLKEVKQHYSLHCLLKSTTVPTLFIDSTPALLEIDDEKWKK